ncbi:MAG: lytic murein transglycosylase [Paracoccaceae bacterium]
MIRSTLLAALLIAGPAIAGPDAERADMTQAGPTAPTDLVLAQATGSGAFDAWIRDFRRTALANGIQASVFDRAFANVRVNAEVIERDRNQAEFNLTLAEYLDRVVSDTRVRNGREMLRQYRPQLDWIENRYGVDAETVVAIWGMESAYGTRRGDIPVIEALANLAWDGRRGRFFRQQLLAALRILQAGDTTPDQFVGSWAGAMGHTQFIPTSFEAYAVDATGDGRRDIWSDDPSDSLASTAAYLARFGWRRGEPWGVEVRLPRGFDYSQARSDVRRMPSDWAARGVVGVDGRPVRDWGQARLFVPAGATGPAFLTFSNFTAIERYNAADAYVVGVGHLSDRIGGAGGFAQPFDPNDRALSREEVRELQQRLTAAGFSTQGADGRVGPNTRAAVRRYQASQGLAVDGYASAMILDRLRR